MTLWELAKRLLYPDSTWASHLQHMKRQGEKQGVHWSRAKEPWSATFRQSLEEEGLSNTYIHNEDLFESEEDFWRDHDDYELGRVFGCGTKETDNQGQLIIYTGWYKWSDGSIRSSAEEKPPRPCSVGPDYCDKA